VCLDYTQRGFARRCFFLCAHTGARRVRSVNARDSRNFAQAGGGERTILQTIADSASALGLSTSVQSSVAKRLSPTGASLIRGGNIGTPAACSALPRSHQRSIRSRTNAVPLSLNLVRNAYYWALLNCVLSLTTPHTFLTAFS